MLVLNVTGPQPEAPLEEVAWEDHLAQAAFITGQRLVVDGARGLGY